MKKKTETKRQAILEVAAQAFRELGFERTSMSEICTRVGGSKATIYNYFASKDELFFATMLMAGEAEFETVHQAFEAASDDMAQALRSFGEKLLAFLYSPRIQAQRRLAVAESGRTALGRLVYEQGVMRSLGLMADFLQQAMDQGRLRPADPHIAARHLQSLLESELLERFLFQLLGEVTAEEISAVTGRAIDVFLAAYGPVGKPIRSGGKA